MRMHGDITSTPLPGWDKQATERPTSFMMVTKFAGVIVLKLGHHRQLARPLSGVQQQYLTALDVPATCFTLPAGSPRTAMARERLLRPLALQSSIPHPFDATNRSCRLRSRL